MEGRREDGSFDVLWLTPQGAEMTEDDWNFPEGRFLAYVLGPVEGSPATLFVVLNAATEAITLTLPRLPGATRWTILLETAQQPRTGQELPADSTLEAAPERSWCSRAENEASRGHRRRTGARSRAGHQIQAPRRMPAAARMTIPAME